MSGQWEHSGSQWELAAYQEDIPRQTRNRVVGAMVTDEFIANVASPAQAAVHLFNKIGSVPPPLAGYLPPHDPDVVVYDMGEP